MITVAIGSVVVSAILWLVGTRFSPEWEKREMDRFKGKWNTLFGIGTVFAIATALAAFLLGADPVWAISLSIVAWIIPLVSAVDFTTMLIPREIVIAAYYLPLPLLAFSLWQVRDWNPLINVGLWGVLVVLALLAVLRGKLGMGDFRLLLLFGTALAWWAGAYYLVLGLLAAVVIQLLLTVFALITKSVGVKRSVTPLTADTDETDELEVTTEGTEEAKEPKQRLFLPFGPSLLVGALAAALLASHLPQDELLALFIM